MAELSLSIRNLRVAIWELVVQRKTATDATASHLGWQPSLTSNNNYTEDCPSQYSERPKEECIQSYSNLKKGKAMNITADISNTAREN